MNGVRIATFDALLAGGGDGTFSRAPIEDQDKLRARFAAAGLVLAHDVNGSVRSAGFAARELGLVVLTIGNERDAWVASNADARALRARTQLMEAEPGNFVGFHLANSDVDLVLAALAARQSSGL